MEALRVEALSAEFGGVQAVRGVSMTVEAGARVGFIGPNGAGKTTLFNLLGGQLGATSGRTYCFGRDITNLSAHRRSGIGIARSFQVASLFPRLVVEEQAELAIQGKAPYRSNMVRSVGSYPRCKEDARELLGAWGLLQQRDKYPSQLSHGEQRRLEIALSLASRPRILLLDEPNTGLTADESLHLIGTVYELGQGTTVLIATHDMDVVFGVAERVVVLHRGQIVADGSPEVIQSDPVVADIYMGPNGSARHAATS